MNGPLQQGFPCHQKQQNGRTHNSETASNEVFRQRRLPAQVLSVCGRDRRGLSMTPELITTETRSVSTPAADRDELAELLLYVWLRSEIKDDWGLPLVMEQ